MGLPEGLNHMDGDTALEYSRIRYLDSDFGRTNRQRKILTALYNSAKNLGLADFFSLTDQLFPLLTTDMSNLKIISMITELFPMLSSSHLETLCIPAEGTYSFHTVNGMSVIVADFDANQNILAETLAPSTEN